MEELVISDGAADRVVRVVFAVGLALAIVLVAPLIIHQKLTSGVRRGPPSWARSGR